MGDFVKCNNATDHNCPEDGHYLFNTAVAFDPKGNLVAKYHKMQVYYEPMYNIPTKPQLIHFDTPFGRMGLHICFDILFNLPGTKLISDYNVTTMLFPTWWYDELPFVFATQMQQSWAIANRVNLLAANTHFPETGFTTLLLFLKFKAILSNDRFFGKWNIFWRKWGYSL